MNRTELNADLLEYGTAFEAENDANKGTPCFFYCDHLGHGGQGWGYYAPISSFGGAFRNDDPETYHSHLTEFIEAVRYMVEELEGEEMPENFNVEVFGLDN